MHDVVVIHFSGAKMIYLSPSHAGLFSQALQFWDSQSNLRCQVYLHQQLPLLHLLLSDNF